MASTLLMDYVSVESWSFSSDSRQSGLHFVTQRTGATLLLPGYLESTASAGRRRKCEIKDKTTCTPLRMEGGVEYLSWRGRQTTL